jgi:hypothetical protein
MELMATQVMPKVARAIASAKSTRPRAAGNAPI